MYMITWLYSIILLAFCGNVYCKTAKDRLFEAMLGDPKVIIGAVYGDVSTIKRGYGEGGNARAILSATLGESLLMLGTPYVDFPVAPAIHVAISQGQKEHLDAAFFLLKTGADLADYKLPTMFRNGSEASLIPRGYAPALLYALGLGAEPTASHAAVLYRLHVSFPEFFNFSKINDWIDATGNYQLGALFYVRINHLLYYFFR